MIFSELLSRMEQGENTVLVSITAEKGSAPRGCGAQMLVGSAGCLQGTVGGGSLELEAVEMAKAFLRSEHSSARKPLMHEFLLREQQKGNVGMVCGGDVIMLFLHISADDICWKDVAEKTVAQIARKQAGWLVLQTDSGEPSLLDDQGTLLAGAPVERITCLSGKNGLLDGSSFYLPISIGERVVIFGGGHCAFALVPLLESVGFRVHLVDCRPEFATTQRFPDAEQVICWAYERLDEALKLNEDDFVVIMTHSHAYDALVQEWVLRQKAAYVGALGSRRKIAFINEILREKQIPEEAIQSVHSPIGVSIKAATPEEIAVSIAGEMIYERAVLREQAEGNSRTH